MLHCYWLEKAFYWKKLQLAFWKHFHTSIWLLPNTAECSETEFLLFMTWHFYLSNQSWGANQIFRRLFGGVCVRVMKERDRQGQTCAASVRGEETISLLGDCSGVHHVGLFCFNVSHEVCCCSSSWYCTSPAQRFPCVHHVKSSSWRDVSTSNSSCCLSQLFQKIKKHC